MTLDHFQKIFLALKCHCNDFLKCGIQLLDFLRNWIVNAFDSVLGVLVEGVIRIRADISTNYFLKHLIVSSIQPIVDLVFIVDLDLIEFFLCRSYKSFEIFLSDKGVHFFDKVGDVVIDPMKEIVLVLHEASFMLFLELCGHLAQFQWMQYLKLVFVFDMEVVRGVVEEGVFGLYALTVCAIGVVVMLFDHAEIWRESI